MGRRPNTELREAVKQLYSSGTHEVKAIARTLAIDPRAVRYHLRALKAAGGAFSEVPEGALAGPTGPVSTSHEALVERAQAARDRLWEVLNSPSSNGSAIVAAFNALAESEGWAGMLTVSLPEPKSLEEAADRVVAFLDSLDDDERSFVLDRIYTTFTQAPAAPPA